MGVVNTSQQGTIGLARDLSREFYRRGLIKTWSRDRPEGWTLVSGLWSPFYLQLRLLPSHPDLLKRIAQAFGQFLSGESLPATRLVGVAMAGIPISTATSVETGIPGGYTRKIEGARSVEAFRSRLADYGQHSLIESELVEGDRVVLVDDLVTRFDSKLVAIEMLQTEIGRRGIKGAKVSGVLVIVDREQGASEHAARLGIRLHSLLRFASDCVPQLEGVASPDELNVLSSYLKDPTAFQSRAVQRDLFNKATRARTNH